MKVMTRSNFYLVMQSGLFKSKPIKICTSLAQAQVFSKDVKKAVIFKQSGVDSDLQEITAED